MKHRPGSKQCLLPHTFNEEGGKVCWQAKVWPDHKAGHESFLNTAVHPQKSWETDQERYRTDV